MGAEDRWHEHGPVKDGDPIISPSVLLMMQGQGSAEQSVLPWEVDPEAAFDPRSTPDVSPESEDVLANLLRAIENTDIASRFSGVTPPENGRPSVLTSAQTAEIDEVVSALLQEPVPETDAAACSEPTPGTGAESNEAITNLLRAIRDTEIASTLAGIPRADSTEPVDSACAQPAETAEAAFTTSDEPETDAAAHFELTPQGALEMGEPAAKPMDVFVNAETAARLDGAPAQFDAESSEIVSSGQEDSEATDAIAEPPDFRARRKALRQQDRHPKRVVRRRNSNRRKPNNPLSSPASTSATPSAAADAATAESLAAILDTAIEEPLPVAVEPEPEGAAASADRAEILGVALAPVIPEPPTRIELEPTTVIEPLVPAEPPHALAAPVAAEPERPSTAELELPDDTPILAAAEEAVTPKAPVRVRLSTGIGNLAATGDLINGGLDRAELRLENWFQKWLGPPDPRRNERVDKPPLVAYHWIADVSQALKIADISAGGLHLVTKDRWSEGNIVSMTLQRTDKEKGSPDSWIAVDFLVMRWCEDGMAGAFMPSVRGLSYTVAGRAANCADKKTLERFMDRLIDAAADRLALRK